MTLGAAARSPETKAAEHDFLAAFEAFKAANDQRLDELERKGGADTLLDEKVARIDAALTEQKSALDRMALNARRPALESDERRERSARGRAFDAYARAGDASGLLQVKALSAGSDPDGGHVVPDETEAAIDRRLTEVSPIRAIATVRQVSAATFKKPVSLGGATAGWAAETAARTQTTSPTLDLIEFPTFELYAMPAATQQLLDDAAVNIDEWLAEEVRDVFAVQESAAFVTGDGSGKPTGFLSYDAAAEGTQDADELGYLATGTAGDFDADDPLDALIELIYAPRPAYAPVHVRGTREPDGVRLSWTRRSRIGGDSWAGEVPLGEEAEAYEVDILSEGETALTLETSSPSVLLTLAQEAAIFGGPVWSFDVLVFQVSPAHGRGAAGARTLYLAP
jgi:HK97 family phage major capsid protein